MSLLDVDEKTLKHYLMAGHGRGYEIVAANTSKYRKIILEMCTEDTSFDLQCEGSRAAYTYDITMLYDDYKPFMRKALRKFADESVDTDWHLMNHLTNLITLYALESNEEKAEKALFKKYDKLYEKLMTRRFSAALNEVCQCFEVLMVEIVSQYEFGWTEKIAHDLGAWFIRRKSADKDMLKWQFAWLFNTMKNVHGEDTLRIQLEEAAKNSKEIRRFVTIMFPEKQDDCGCEDYYDIWMYGVIRGEPCHLELFVMI